MNTELLFQAGKEVIRSFGFLSPRAVGDTTFLYGDVGANWLVRLSGSHLNFYRYSPVSDSYLPELRKGVRLPHSVKEGSLLVHIDTATEEKNTFSMTFAILEKEGGNITIEVVKRTESYDLLPDIRMMVKDAAAKGLAELYRAVDEIDASKRHVEVSTVRYPTAIPCGGKARVFGGRGTIVINCAQDVHVLTFREGKLMHRQQKIAFVSKTPIFEIVANGEVAIIDGPSVTLWDCGTTKSVDLRQFGGELELSGVKYALVGSAEGKAELFFYCDGKEKFVMVETDPDSPGYGSARLFSAVR